MQLSTKSRYGLKAMIELGSFNANEKISLRKIALKYEISESYLEQIIAILKTNNLVKSTRGVKGGYSLAKPTIDISLGDILRALEGNLNVVNCVSHNQEQSCSKIGNCSFKYMWDRLTKGITELVDNITLEELIKDHLRIQTIKERG